MTKSKIPLTAGKLSVLVIMLLVCIPALAQVENAWVSNNRGAITSLSDTLFFDDFSDGNDDGWTHFTLNGLCGTWSVSGGVYDISNYVGDVGSCTWTTGTWSFAGDYSWTDYTLSGDFRHNYSRKCLYFTVRAQDDRNFYRVGYEDSRWVIWRWVYGSPSLLLSTSASLQSGIWYHMEISVLGSQISLSVDGTPILETSDGTFTHGAIGLEAEDCRVSFDNILVSETATLPRYYAVVASNSTISDPQWLNVVTTLKSKHSGKIFSYSGSVLNVQSALADFDPQYICFVSKPEEIISYGCSLYVRDIYQLTRALDDDVFGDALWGIVTGYNAQDALRIVNGPAKITISNGLLATQGDWLDYLRKGTYFSETEYNVMWTTDSCGPIDKSHPGPTDPTDTMVALLNNNTTDIMVTSGHANQHAWQIHYPDSELAGHFRSSAGQLYGDPYFGPETNVNSTNPKVYYAPGNCLIGDISDMDCMVLAWIHTGGAYQYCGYTVETAYGHMGWGMADYLFPLQDVFNYATAFYLSNQVLLFWLEYISPGNPELLYDKDVVAFYGDPACDARLEKCQDPLYTLDLLFPGHVLTKGLVTNLDTLTLTVTMNTIGHPSRPPIALFSGFSADSIQILYTNAYHAVVTDNFALLDIWHEGDPDLNMGEQREVKFTGKLSPTLPGDANQDGVIDLGDVVYLITYLYKNGPAPNPLAVGDLNCSGVVELGDVVYLISYLYKGGPPPSCK